MLPALHRFASVPFEKSDKKTFNQKRQAARAKCEKVRYEPAHPKMLVLTPTPRTGPCKLYNPLKDYSAVSQAFPYCCHSGRHALSEADATAGKKPGNSGRYPGRLIDHMHSGKIRFDQLEILVLDEADRMLDMGFIDDIETIIAATPETRQTMLFSATLDGIVGNMARKITRDPELIHIHSVASRHENIDQMIHFVDDLPHKNRLLDHLLHDRSLDQALVFTATKRDADIVADRLAIAGFSACGTPRRHATGSTQQNPDEIAQGSGQDSRCNGRRGTWHRYPEHHARSQL